MLVWMLFLRHVPAFRDLAATLLPSVLAPMIPVESRTGNSVPSIAPIPSGRHGRTMSDFAAAAAVGAGSPPPNARPLSFRFGQNHPEQFRSGNEYDRVARRRSSSLGATMPPVTAELDIQENYL